MEVMDLPLAGLKLLKPVVHRDARGFFLESYQRARYAALGIDCEFVQDSHSLSSAGTLRGLHYQSKPGQAKLVRCTRGCVFDVAVDIRPESSTFGRWFGAELSAESHEQMFIPVGFAHGYYVLTELAEFQYKVSAPYDPVTESSIRWNDPRLAIAWPNENPILSARDQVAESFDDFAKRVKR
jgi:dTDP-4-dehydrorhamnose 3,5-epimerase